MQHFAKHVFQRLAVDGHRVKDRCLPHVHHLRGIASGDGMFWRLVHIFRRGEGRRRGSDPVDAASARAWALVKTLDGSIVVPGILYLTVDCRTFCVGKVELVER